MTQPIAWTTLWEATPNCPYPGDFDLSETTNGDRLVLEARSEYAVDLDFHQATALRDALDGWLLRHAYMAD